MINNNNNNNNKLYKANTTTNIKIQNYKRNIFPFLLFSRFVRPVAIITNNKIPNPHTHTHNFVI